MNRIAAIIAVILALSQTSATLPEQVGEFVPSELDCNGESFTILHDSRFTLLPDEENGDIVNDAQYRAMMDVTLLHNVRLTPLMTDNPYRLTQNAVLAADPIYEAVLVDYGEVMRMGLNGFMNNLASVPELQLDGIWWNRALNEQLTVGENQLYGLANDISPENFGSVSAMLYDSGCYGDKPIELVRSGDWTLDRLLELQRDGAFADWRGITFVGARSTDALLTASGADFIEKDGETLTLASPTAPMLDAIDRIGELLTYRTDNAGMTVAAVGDTVTHLHGGQYLDSVRVVPLPKLDPEADYISPITETYDLLAIPVVNDRTATAGTILNALQYYSSRYVLPAQLARHSQSKVAVIDEITEMIELIRGGLTFDERDVYNLPSLRGGELTYAIGSGSYVSHAVMLEQRAQRMLDEACETLAELREMGR